MAEKLEIIEVLHKAKDAAIKSGVATRIQLLELLDKAPATFDNELNVWKNPECRNKLGLEDAWKLIKACNAVPVLSYMAAELGYTLSPMDESAPDGKDMDEECLQAFRAIAKLEAAVKDDTPYQELIRLDAVTHREVGHIIKRRRMEQTQGKTRPVQIRKAG